MSMHPVARITAVIPIHNGMPHIIRCIESLKKREGGDYQLHIIVVNDGSTDASEVEIQKTFPDVEIVSGHGELWWTGAMEIGTNVALAHGCDYVLWLNHDDQITSTSIETLLNFSRSHPRTIGCCGVTSMSAPNERMLLGYRLHLHQFYRWYLETLWSSSSKLTTPVELNLNGGHGILIPAEVFSNPKNHLRPKLLPHYFGDFDFFYRVRKNGWKVLSVPGAVILNDDGNSGILNGRKISSYRQSLAYVLSRRSLANLRDRPLFALINFPWGLNLFWAVVFWVIPIGCAVVYPTQSVFRRYRSATQPK